MGDWKEDPNFVGIVPLEANLTQKAIERLGPPPGNAEILIRGGAGWVFGIEPQRTIEQPGILHLKGDLPRVAEVSLALAREMAWRWISGRPPFVAGTGYVPQKPAKGALNVNLYARTEPGFVDQVLGLTPRFLPVEIGTVPISDAKVTCVCTQGTRCCAGICQTCQAG